VTFVVPVGPIARYKRVGPQGSLTAARPRRIFTAFPDACADKKAKCRVDVKLKIHRE
jgi:hypothetical protein